MEYLIQTYTNAGETVLDFAMGSGSTGVACLNLNRRFVGIELNATFFNIAQNRLHNRKKGISDEEDTTINPAAPGATWGRKPGIQGGI